MLKTKIKYSAKVKTPNRKTVAKMFPCILIFAMYEQCACASPQSYNI